MESKGKLNGEYMIYVITHKLFDDSFLDRKHYEVLHVGKNDSCSYSWLRDDTGDQISDKNSSYCELTGLYWIWKNSNEQADDITGLVHYRRFFTTEEENRRYIRDGIMPHLLSWNVIEKSTAQGNVILPKETKTLDTVYRTYGRVHFAGDLDETGKSIHKLCPSYDESFQKVMNSHRISYANMMICTKQVLDEYCRWLFPVLSETEKNLALSRQNENKKSSYQSRVMGFLGERLLNVWMLHNNMKTDRYPVFNTEKPDMTFLQLTEYRFRTFIRIAEGKNRKQ